IVAEETGAPFSLERGPLVRGSLVRMGPDEHVLLVTLHHIVSDGWSMGVWTNELSALYAAYRRGEPDPLPPLEIQYADYAAWQRTWVDGEVLQRQAEYWRRTLSGAPELLELPADHPRPARQDFAGATARLMLDEELTDGLKALSQRHGTTLFMTVLAGWAVVLGRLSGQEDVVVGTPSANRGRREIEGLIGCFVNSLALRVDLAGAPTVAEMLARVKTRALEAQQNQDIPFEQVVELVQPARSLAHTPLFQVMFAWQNASRGGLALPGLKLAPAGAASQVTAKFDLMLSLGEAGGRIAGGMEYATALFERETVERWLGYLRRVLEAFAADDALRLDAIRLLPEGERQLVLRVWNATGAADPPEACVHELFEAQVARTPDAVAVIHERAHLTYAELNRRTNRLARHLVRLGAGPEARVGVCLERGLELVVSLLAVLKTGAAYLPLDPAYPAERLAYMLADAGAAVLVTQEKLRTLLEAPPRAAVASVDGAAAAEIGREDGDDPEVAVAPRNLAYLIYTSGSTGVPKGVAIEHGNAVALLAWAWSVYSREELSGVLASTSVCFDLSVFELFVPLTRGGCAIVVENALALPASAAAGAVRLVNTVPSAIAALLEPGGLPAGVRTVCLAGEPLRQEVAEALYARGVERVYDLYGPSEDTTYSTCGLREAGGEPHIGRPIAHTRCYVLDGARRPMPVGVPGELYIGGRGVARGYLGRPWLSAERFVPDPFSSGPGQRMYRTGDRVRWKSDGTLEYLGRLDHQVKIRGFRVEPGEIEVVLRRHPGVDDCAVVVHDDASGDRRLVAYLVGTAGTDEARAHLGETLPEYMVPPAYVRLERLPLTPNGKLDRKALPAPAGDAYARRDFQAPEGDTEEALAKIWSEVLGLERVGRWDHFFQLGGHSLLAVQVVSRVRQVLGVELALGAVFDHPVLATLAGHVLGLEPARFPPETLAVQSASIERAAPALSPIEPVERSGPLPLSFAQARLWFMDRMEGASAAYHISTGLRLSGALDRAALARALDGMVRRHEALRTTFAEVDGEPVQRIAPVEASRFHLVDHDLGNSDGAGEELRRIVAEEREAPFSLERGPLVRGRLVRMGPDEHVLLVTMHHIVSDGWSMGVWTTELGALYGAYRRGEPDPLPPLELQYADYA
ncbi:MAG TPA: amino acid adenylation domain-containing protein, partial [Longimicrobium sp.]|nr:amino acid adenylation domain-containing protein [Longimicrobium sp.]